MTLNAFSGEKNVHVKDHIKAYNYFNDNYSYKNVVNEEDEVITLKTKYANEKTIGIKANRSIYKFLKNNFDKSKIQYDYDGKGEVTYFTKQGTKLGRVKVKYNNEVLDEFDLIYHGSLTFSLAAYLWSNKLFIITIILFLVLIVYTKSTKTKRG